MLKKNVPALILAPMEGVTDAPMRALLSELGGFSFCVSEFLRVSQNVPPPKVFFRHIPELKTHCRTASGQAVQIQLLGGDPEKMAATAFLACQLGAPGIDLNFGCPAPVVNRHDGGATLLKHPERIKDIVSAVRQRVPPQLPVSVKMRLGWDNPDPLWKNAEMAARGGASWLTVHARTKVQGYAPPVNWKALGQLKKNLDIPLVANGDIWNIDDFRRCQEETQCQHFMLGRGAVASPFLVRTIAGELGLSSPLESVIPPLSWKNLVSRFVEINFLQQDQSQNEFLPKQLCGRIKQWGAIVSKQQPLPWFNSIRKLQNLEEILQTISQMEIADEN